MLCTVLLQSKDCQKPIIKSLELLIHVCLCVKVEDEKSAGESQTKQEKEKHDEKKDDSEEGTDRAGKCIINFTHRHQDQDNVSIKTCTADSK